MIENNSQQAPGLELLGVTFIVLIIFGIIFFVVRKIII